MNKLTELVVANIPKDIFTDLDLINLIGGSDDKRYGLVKRACASDGIVRIKKGLYCLSPKYQRRKINLYQLAQYIYGPSYVSMESALSYHGWIPEAVHTLTSACVKKSRDFMTPLGAFNFRRVPSAFFYGNTAKSAGGLCLYPPGKLGRVSPGDREPARRTGLPERTGAGSI